MRRDSLPRVGTTHGAIALIVWVATVAVVWSTFFLSRNCEDLYRDDGWGGPPPIAAAVLAVASLGRRPAGLIAVAVLSAVPVALWPLRGRFTRTVLTAMILVAFAWALFCVIAIFSPLVGIRHGLR